MSGPDPTPWQAWKRDPVYRSGVRGARAMQILRESPLAPFLAFKDDAVMLRHPRVSADFNQARGCWRDSRDAHTTIDGGADQFIAWAMKKINAP